MLPYPSKTASYAVPVRPFRLLQSRLLQTPVHTDSPCGLLTGFGNLPVRDFHPLACGINPVYSIHLWNGVHSRHTQSIAAIAGKSPLRQLCGTLFKILRCAAHLEQRFSGKPVLHKLLRSAPNLAQHGTCGNSKIFSAAPKISELRMSRKTLGETLRVLKIKMS